MSNVPISYFLRNALILGKEKGENIALEDSDEGELFITKILGNSKQDGEPSLENKADIKSAGDEGNINFTISNQNVAKIDERYWELTENKTIKNKNQNTGIILTEFEVKEGQTVNVYLKLLSKPSKATTFTAYIDTVVNNTIAFNNFNIFELNTIYKKTFVAEKDCKLRYTMWGNADRETFEFQFWAEIDTSDLADNYILHKGQSIEIPVQQPFRKIGDIRDIFIRQNGKWYEQHNIERYNLTGDEILTQSSSPPNRYSIYIPSNSQIALPDYDYRTDILCNMFINTTNYSSGEGGKFGHFNLSTNFLIFSDIDNEYTLDAFKAKLKELYDAEKPVYIDYVLAEPKLIECTEEQTKILNSLVDLHSYKRTTHIFSTDEVGPVFEVVYAKDISKLFGKE